MDWSIVVTEMDAATLTPEIWTASMVFFSQNLSAPDPAQSCGMEWASALAQLGDGLPPVDHGVSQGAA